MSILSSIGRIAARYNDARSRSRTERAIHLLPLEVQKDIGWPEISECSPNRQIVHGLSAAICGGAGSGN